MEEKVKNKKRLTKQVITPVRDRPTIPEDIDENKIGPQIRLIRQSKNLTINNVSKKAKCTTATISKVERNQITPSISVLKGIINALGMTLVEFLSDNDASESVVMRKNKRVKIKFPQPGIKSELLVTNLSQRKMQPLYEIIEPGAGSEGNYQHEGEEFLIVLKGILTVEVDGVIYELADGDSIYYNCDNPHSFSNQGSVPVEVIWVITPPTY
jgi:mannose-6-phosphate isomerase-like protein (cupin superfamily)